eukprot:TRINITY_DN17950_c0_g1_i1.p1 TRINITY_DN17950_c0_g1~~TRINITY_DN17950_c0_g1_i1.p1  ORF type:complete len:1086 (-),score=407.11 TRINITY_DN17950_c0_g1_i1:129-3386(-)
MDIPGDKPSPPMSPIFLPTVTLNSPIPHASLPSCPLPPSSLPISSALPPNLSTVIASLASNPSTLPTKPTSQHSKTKDGLIRMLLQSNPLQLSQLSRPLSSPVPHPSLPTTQDPSPHSEDPDCAQAPYLSRLCGTERLISLIQLDHCYTKPWNWKPESSLCQPTKTLFVPRVSRNSGLGEHEESVDQYVDVVSEPVKPVPPYDPQQAGKVMTECDRFINFARPSLVWGEEEEKDITGWEEKIVKDTWSQAQGKLFSKIMKVLTQDRLARLALEGGDNEPVLRRIAIDKSCRRARAVLASPPCVWDRAMVQWLHSTLTTHLPSPHLSAWLDILQTLRSKVPHLLDRLLAGPAGHHIDPRARTIAQEGLAVLLRRPWDPAASSLARRRLGRLPGNPILVVAPPGPADPRTMSRRLRLWNNQLGCLGKVIVINMPAPRGEAAVKTLVNHYLHQMVSATLGKVREIKNTSGDRPVVLLGWGVGAAIAAHVAGIEKLGGLICLGFPVSTLAGLRGQVGDSLLEVKTPVLFVIGERATQAGSDDVEDIRERLGVETGLVIVGGADDQLRLSRKKKKAECVTQSMVDRCIMDQVRDFLVSVLSKQPQSSSLQMQEPTFAVPSHDSFVSIAGVPRKVKARKRNSSASADGSGPLSPTKKSRPSLPTTLLPTIPGRLVGAAGAGGISLSGGPQGTTPIHILPQTPAPKKARKPKKSKSTDSETVQSFSVLPHLNNPLPASLLSISTPLPQTSSSLCSLSPPALPIRIPFPLSNPPLVSSSPLLSSALQSPNHPTMATSPRSPQPQLPTSPTPRVIQYAGRGKGFPDPTPKSPGPVTHNPTTPTWTVAVSRPVAATKPALAQQHAARPGQALHQPPRPGAPSPQTRPGLSYPRPGGPRQMILAQQPGNHRPQPVKQQLSSRPATPTTRPGVPQPAALQLQLPSPQPRQGTSSSSTSPDKLLILMGQGRDAVSPGKSKSLTPSDRQDVANILANLSGIMVEPADTITTSKVATPKPGVTRAGSSSGSRPSLTVSTTEKRPGIASSLSPGNLKTSPGSSSVMLKVSPGSSNSTSIKPSSVSPKSSNSDNCDVKVSKE